MDKRKKNILIISGCLAVSGVLLLSIFSDKTEPIPSSVQEVPLRADIGDVSLSDMIQSVENRKGTSNVNTSSGLTYNNASSL